MKKLPLLSTIPDFDPKQAPLLPRDERYQALPAAVVNETFLIHRLAHSLSAGQRQNAHIPNNPILKPSAVLIPIMQRASELTVLLTLRSAKLRKHSGQIALPGGKIDAEDTSPIATALREAHEEIGLSPANCQVIGALPLHETGTGFEITPIVALVNPNHPTPYTPVLSEDEVSEIFEIPLQHILNPTNHNHHELSWINDEGPQTRDWYGIPSIDLDGKARHIWGVTARVLRNFYEHLHEMPQ
ncbi:MAG: CoA pyrophosphatase [Cytophagales bacterium]|nr:CoA pyrophosphatase [Cytophagales bacterium]